MGGVENPRRRGEKIRGNKWKLFSKIIEHLRLAPIWPGDEDIVIWWEIIDSFNDISFLLSVLPVCTDSLCSICSRTSSHTGRCPRWCRAGRNSSPSEISDVDHEEDEGGRLMKKEWDHLKVCYCQLDVMSAWNLNIPEVEEFNCLKIWKTVQSSIW